MLEQNSFTRRGFLGLAIAGLTALAGACGPRRGFVRSASPPAARLVPPSPTADADLSDVFTKGGQFTSARVFEVIAREGWRAKKPKGAFIPQAIDRLTVHHSATPLKNNADAPAHFRLFQKIHLRKRPDIAYHLLIDRKGNIYEGRPILARGESTATKKSNGYDATGHLLVMCDGNFETQNLSQAQAESLANVLAWASVRFNVSPATIRGHRNYAPTACPGKHLYELITSGALRKAVEQRVAAGGYDAVLLSKTDSKTRVAAIEG